MSEGISFIRCFRRNRISLFFLILPPLILFPSIRDFHFPSYPFTGKPYSDLVISHYPNAIFLISAIKEWQIIPLWNPTILGGYPFFADPLSGLWYPFGWIGLFFPLPLGFNLAFILHLVWLGLGVYRWLIAEGISHRAALWGALVIESLPKIYAHFAAGHITLLYSLSWTPWLLYATRLNGIEIHLMKVKARVPPGFILALMFLADVRWIAYAGMVWLVYLLWHKLLTKRIFLDISLALLLASPLMIPLIEYVSLSTRSTMSPQDALSFSLPIVGLLGMFFPDFKGFFEWTCYPGLTSWIFALYVIFHPSNQRLKIFWGITFLTAILFSLGSNFPPNIFIVQLPILGLLRIPARALFVADFALVVLASYGLDVFLRDRKLRTNSRISLLLFGITVFYLILTLGIKYLDLSLPYNYLWSIGIIFILAVLFVLYIQGITTSKQWFVLTTGICVLEFAIINCFSFISRNKEEVLSEQGEVAQYLSNQPGKWRIFSPSYSVPQHISVLHGFESADGINPIQISSYVDFMKRASGIPIRGYSVTMPPFDNGEVATANMYYKPNAELLGLLNVAYVIAEYPLDVQGFNLITKFGNTHIYGNQHIKPRAWIQSETLNGYIKAAEIISWNPNRLSLRVRGPGLLVLSEIVYPGWWAFIDGRHVDIVSFQGIFRGVELLEPGEHYIEFLFCPVSLVIGLSLSLLGLFLFVKTSVSLDG